MERKNARRPEAFFIKKRFTGIFSLILGLLACWPMPELLAANSSDFNADGRVDVVDLGVLLSHWGITSKPPADLNQDGKVDVQDLGILLSNWGSKSPSGMDVCAGLVQDKIPRQQPQVDKPALGQAITDPVFGTQVRRITAVSESEGGNAVIKPMYNTIQAWNADESYLILWHRGGSGKGHELYNGRTYQLIRSLGDLISPTDIEQILWDPEDPDVFYYPSNYKSIPNLYRYRVSKAANEIARTFDDICGPSASLSLGSDPMYLSWADGTKVVGLQCGQDKKFLYDIKNNKVLGILTNVPAEWSWFAPQPAPSGQFALGYTNVYDSSFQFLRKLNIAAKPEHGSIGRTSDGHDAYFTVVFDPLAGGEVGTLIRFDLDTGNMIPIIAPATGYLPYPPSNTHISALAYKNQDWVGVSVVGSPPYDRVLSQEIMVANAVTGVVCRVAHHHSAAQDGKWGYWAEPHVVISPSGTRLLFGSDWGNGSSVDTYVVELPSYSP